MSFHTLGRSTRDDVKMKISTCLSTNPVKFDAVPFKGDFQTNVQTIANLGFDGIELFIRDPSIIDQDFTIKIIQNAKLQIPAIGTGQAWGEDHLSFTAPDIKVREAAIERIFSHIHFAHKSGAVIIIGLIRGNIMPEIPRERTWAWMREAFTTSVQEAAKLNVRIAFEPINRYETNFLNSVEDGLRFIEGIGYENLGMLLDSFHMNIEAPSIEKSIRLAGEKIFHFHYADSNRLYPGAGHLDFTSILKTLYETGYKGFISGEHRPDPNPKVAVRNGLQYMRNLEKKSKDIKGVKL